eukprot:TCONS_00069650-protein
MKFPNTFKMKVLICVFLTIGATWAWNEHMEDAGLYEGDIKLSYKQLLFGSIRGKRWTNNIVPYVVHSTLASRENVINDAIGVYHKRTCLKFVKRTNQPNYIEFFQGSGCWSFVGMNGGKQQISLGPGCLWTATAQHEIGHAIGLQHEQTRPDRNQYVKIHLNNLNDQDNAYNFHLNRDIDSLGTPYDFYSMMHYGSTAFAKSGTKTITTLDPSKQRIIDNNYHYGMSDIDAKQIKLMYNCDGNGGNNNNGDLKNDGENCYYKCGHKGGSCPQYCGRTGLCCRVGYNDPGCEQASKPCYSYHCCTAPKKEVKNIGKNCWYDCSYKGGPCSSGFCGKDGICCRKGYNDKGCENAQAACDGKHCCTA